MLVDGDEVGQAGMGGALILEPHKHNVPVWQRCHLHQTDTQMSFAQTDRQTDRLDVICQHVDKLAIICTQDKEIGCHLHKTRLNWL